jgi:pyruvate dehydrogenase kinase 2/3/4
MHRMLRSRISRRVITEQHIALTTQFRERQRDRGKSSSEERRVGVVDTKLNAAEVASKCSQLIRGRGGPEGMVPVILDGELGTSFAYIPEHLE